MGLPDGKYDAPLALSAKYYNQDGTLWDPEANGEASSDVRTVCGTYTNSFFRVLPFTVMWCMSTERRDLTWMLNRENTVSAC
jgi:hypothetical protein